MWIKMEPYGLVTPYPIAADQKGTLSCVIAIKCKIN